MKRRWTILFFIALSPLIGLSWLFAKLGASMWSMYNFALIGMVAAAGAAGYAAIRAEGTKWPAAIALAASLPMFRDVLRFIDGIGALFQWFGVSILLITVGSLATTIAALVIVVMPVPPPPKDPQVAPARVVD